jgi:membrane protein DedA with SNARE-associated domain
MIASILGQYPIPAWLGETLGAVLGTVAAYYIALFVKQVLLKKPGGLFTAKF